MKEYILKIAESIAPTPTGTKIPTGEILHLRDRIKHDARNYCERANQTHKLATALELANDEASIRAYVERKADMKADYIAKGIKGITNRFILDNAKNALETEYTQICKANRPERYVLDAQITMAVSRFVIYNEKNAKPFHVDNAAIDEATTYYIPDAQLPIYDIHRFIAAMLTEFMGEEIKDDSDISHYFYIDSGIIRPVVHFTIYPPQINEYK